MSELERYLLKRVIDLEAEKVLMKDIPQEVYEPMREVVFGIVLERIRKDGFEIDM